MDISNLLKQVCFWIGRVFCPLFEWIFDNPGPIVALIGIIASYKVLKKKLIEDHVTSAIKRMQIANHQVYKEAERLIDDYVLNEDEDIKINTEQFWDKYGEIQRLSYLSLDGNSELATLTYSLKLILQTYGKESIDKPISSHEIKSVNSFIINILEKVSEYSTKLVPVPKSSKSSDIQLLNKTYREFITSKSITTFKNFNAGVIRDKRSTYQLILFSYINGSSSLLLKYSAQKAFQNTHPFAVLFFNKNLYAPSILELIGFPIWAKTNFILIGFEDHTFYNGDYVSHSIILYYSNFGGIGVINNLNDLNFKERLIDTFTGVSLADLSLTEFKVESGLSETFSFKIDRDDAERLFKENKRKVREKLKGGN